MSEIDKWKNIEKQGNLIFVKNKEKNRIDVRDVNRGLYCPQCRREKRRK